MSNEIAIQQNAAQTVATWRTTTTYEQVFTHIPEGFGRVMAHLGANNVDPIGAPFTMFRRAPDAETEGDIAMAVPIAAPFGGTTETDIEIIELPAGATASVMHQGSYTNLGESYVRLVSWITEHGHQIEGPAREIYMNSPADVAEADLDAGTSVLIPSPSDIEDEIAAIEPTSTLAGKLPGGPKRVAMLRP